MDDRTVELHVSRVYDVRGHALVGILRLTGAVAITRMPSVSLIFAGQKCNLINELERFLGL
jgi:hypothetical protein